MSTNIRNVNKLFAAAILIVSLFVSYTIVTHAQVADTAGVVTDAAVEASGGAGITFPVPELGNCGSKDACRVYCNDGAHAEACVAFAKAHGLINKDEAARAEKFVKNIRAGAGPGGCKSPKECQVFCSDVANVDVCIKFAETHGVSGKEIETGKRLRDYLAGGGEMPGDCTSKESCQVYCSDFAHAEECAVFAKNAGITQVSGNANGIGGSTPPGQFQKVLELIKKGETPGGCASKDACEVYCHTESHREECAVFAEKAGFIPQGEAKRIKDNGFKGPGDCTSPDTCRVYCNDQTHHDECYKFAEERGFLKKEDVRQAKEGLVSLKVGLDHAPPEVASCLKANLGENIIQDIQAGKLTPGQDIAERVRGCFEKFSVRQGAKAIVNNAPPEVASCLKEKLGDSFAQLQSGTAPATPEAADAFRLCSQATHLFKEGGGSVQGNAGGARQMPPQQNFIDVLKTMPAETVACLQEKLGDRFEALKTQGTSVLGSEGGAIARTCLQSSHLMERPMMMPGIPQDVLECVKSSGISIDTTSDPSKNQALKEAINACLQKIRPKVQGGINIPGEGRGTDSLIIGSHDELITACVKKMMEHSRSSGQPANEASIRKECMDEIDGKMPQPVERAMPSQQLIMECVAQGLASGMQKEEVAKRCAEKFNNPFTNPMPSTLPPMHRIDDGGVCAQVITPAHDPVTGACKEFPTPCAVPPGWVHGCGGLGSDASKSRTVCPMMPTVESCPAGQARKVVFSSAECGTYFGCVSDPSSTIPPQQ